MYANIESYPHFLLPSVHVGFGGVRMTRIFIISLTASLVAFWAVSAKADGWHENPHTVGTNHSHAPHSRAPYAWPHMNHEPAITKTMTPPQQVPAQSSEVPYYEYEWQRQPGPPAPSLVAPQFSYPQQGYYPREGEVPQVQGYEYDFGDGATYPPAFPMEGAKWKDPKKVSAFGIHVPQPYSAGAHTHETHIGCLHW